MPLLDEVPLRCLRSSARHREITYRFAWQPIVNTLDWSAYACEALVRGPLGESAASVIDRVSRDRLHAFDMELRQSAIRAAASMNLPCSVSLNFMPQSLQRSSAALDRTVTTIARHGLPLDSVILEMSETELIGDRTAFAGIVNRYRGAGLKVAIDDFGAGYSGLNLLADFQPDIVKLDMHLVRGIDRNGPRQAIVRAIHRACLDLGIDVVAEGLESRAELAWFRDLGVELFQGFLFARPTLEAIPAIWRPQPAECWA